MSRSEVRGDLATDAGSFALWQPEAFRHVTDYDSWSAELEAEPDLLRHVAAGTVVPVGIGEDGAFSFTLRRGDRGGLLRKPTRAELTPREQRYAGFRSQPYLFVSRGAAVLSGIEAVDAKPRGLRLVVPAGRWVVTVVLLDWDEEPGALVDGGPAPHALSDFLVLLDPEVGGPPPYRQRAATFDPV